MNFSVFKKAFVKTIPVLAGFIVLGMAYGILVSTGGHSVLFAFCSSLFVYAGSMQFVSLPLMAAGISPLYLAVTTFLVNARHLFYGISMIDKFKNAGIKKPYLIFALCDETYSLEVSENYPEKDRQKYYFFITILNQSYWVIGSTAGAILGSNISINTKGIDFAMTAFFITIVTEQWISEKNHIPAFIGFISTLICLLIFGKDVFLLPSMGLILLCLIAGKKLIEKKSRKGETNDAD